MVTIIKLCFSNIRAKKFRSFLIILSVALSTALIYSILALSATTTDYFEKTMTKATGNADIIATIHPESTELFTDDLHPYLNSPGDLTHVTSIAPVLQSYGYEDNDGALSAVSLTAISLKDFDNLFPNQLSDTIIDSNDFTGKKVIISEKTAEKNNLTTGDTIEVIISGNLHTFEVWQVISDNNLLTYNSNLLKLLIPSTTIQSFLNTENTASYYYIDITDKNLINNTIESLDNTFTDLEFNEAVSTDGLASQLQIIQIPLALMAISVLLVSCFIIMSSFKIIMIERMPFLGTVRSLGSNIKDSRKLLFLESSFYSVLGGIIGILLGMGTLNVALTAIFSANGSELMDITLFFPTYVLIGLLAAFGIVFISCLSPIRKMTKKSIRSLLFIDIDSESHFSKYRFIFGLLLIITAFVGLNTDLNALNMMIGFLAIVFVIIGSAMLVPTLTWLLSKPLSLILKPMVGYHSQAAATQIKQDKTLLNNIILLSMGLGVILMINNFSAGVGSAVVDIYGKAKADIILFNGHIDNELLDIISDTEGVTHTYATKHLMNMEANNGDVKLPILEGNTGRDMFKYSWDEFSHQVDDDIMNTFETTRSIITTNLLANKYDLNVGDTLSIDFEGTPKDYEIIAIVNSIMNNGNMSFIHDSFFTEDTGRETYENLYINSNQDEATVIDRIKKAYPYQILNLTSVKEMQKGNEEANAQIFNLLKSVSIIAMIIGIIGIFNNYVISFIARRKFIASLRSLGVNKKSLLKLFLTESLICGTIGAVGGMALGSLLIKAISHILPLINLDPSFITYQPEEYIFVAASSIILATISAILPAFSNIRRPIVAELKYE